MANFDEFSGEYRKILERSVALSGDGADYFADYKARYLASIVTTDFEGKVLDFGCGVGLLSHFLLEHLPQSELHGYDVSRESIATLAPELRRGRCFTSEFSELDPDYDLIVVSNVMHHIPPAQRQDTVKLLKSRLAQEGRLVVFEHNPLNPVTRWVVNHCPFDDDAILLRPRELLAYMASAGLGQPQCNYVLFFPRLLRVLRPTEPLLKWLPLGAQYVVVGSRND